VLRRASGSTSASNNCLAAFGRASRDRPFPNKAAQDTSSKWHQESARSRRRTPGILGGAISLRWTVPACHHVALLTPEARVRVGLSPTAKALDLKGRFRCRGGSTPIIGGPLRSPRSGMLHTPPSPRSQSPDCLGANVTPAQHQPSLGPGSQGAAARDRRRVLLPAADWRGRKAYPAAARQKPAQSREDETGHRLGNPISPAANRPCTAD